MSHLSLPFRRLSSLGIEFPFVIAPMVGLSNVAFRELIRAYSPPGIRPLLFTEMISSRRLPNENLSRVEELRIKPGEFFAPQLLGNEERFIAPSVAKLAAHSPWGIDINMGCPVKKVIKHNWGVRLMGDPSYAADVVAVTKKHSPVPVGVKLRAGLGKEADFGYLRGFVAALQGAGVDWITLHARAAVEHHTGPADWGVADRLASECSVPLIANGDVQLASDAVERYLTTRVDGVMIGRAATARPWILWQIARRFGLDRGDRPPPETPEQESREYFRAVLTYIDLLEEYFGDGFWSRKRLDFFIALGSQWFLFGHAFWKATRKGKALKDTREIVRKYGETHEHPIRQRIRFN